MSYGNDSKRAQAFKTIDEAATADLRPGKKALIKPGMTAPIVAAIMSAEE